MASFRAAKITDCDAIVSLMGKYYAEDGYPFSESAARTSLQQFLNSKHLGHLWALDDEGKVVGYMAVTLGFSFEYGGRDAFLDEIYIDTSHRRRGLGRVAMDTAFEYCERNGVQAIHLEVENHREAARRLYESIGFEAHDRYLMSKHLSHRIE